MKKYILLLLFLPCYLYSQTGIFNTKVGFTNYNIGFENISKKEFNNHTKYEIVSMNDNKIQKADSSYTLFFDNKNIILYDKSEEDDPSFVKYNYMYSIFDVLCFEIKYYEISTFLLIEKNTGMFVEILGDFFFSPGGSYLFCASQLENYEPFPNNIQIYKITNGHIWLIAEYYLENWIPCNIKWDNETIFFEQQYSNGKIEYAKITINEL